MAKEGESVDQTQKRMTTLTKNIRSNLGTFINVELLSLAQGLGMVGEDGRVVTNLKDIQKAFKFRLSEQLLQDIYAVYWTSWEGKNNAIAKKVENLVLEKCRIAYEVDTNAHNSKNFTAKRQLERVGFVMNLLREKLKEFRNAFMAKNKFELHDVRLKNSVSDEERLLGLVEEDGGKAFDWFTNVTNYDRETFDWDAYHQNVADAVGNVSKKKAVSRLSTSVSNKKEALKRAVASTSNKTSNIPQVPSMDKPARTSSTAGELMCNKTATSPGDSMSNKTATSPEVPLMRMPVKSPEVPSMDMVDSFPYSITVSVLQCLLTSHSHLLL